MIRGHSSVERNRRWFESIDDQIGRSKHACPRGQDVVQVGRPSKFTPDRTAAIIASIKAGNWLSTAAKSNGVSYKVLREWLKRGESDRPQDSAFREFRDALDAARRRPKNRQ